MSFRSIVQRDSRKIRCLFVTNKFLEIKEDFDLTNKVRKWKWSMSSKAFFKVHRLCWWWSSMTTSTPVTYSSSWRSIQAPFMYLRRGGWGGIWPRQNPGGTSMDGVFFWIGFVEKRGEKRNKALKIHQFLQFLYVWNYIYIYIDLYIRMKIYASNSPMCWNWS